jgi:hypothetical protein
MSVIGIIMVAAAVVTVVLGAKPPADTCATAGHTSD